MTDLPVVSVVMPVYNAERFLCEAVESVLNQEFRDFELIIVDDGSTDQTPRILVEYTKADSRVKVIHQQVNKGVIAALNRGLELASSRYIARMDADDICTPDRLAKQVSYLDDHSKISLVGTAAYLIHADGSRGIKITVPLSPGMVRWGMNFGCPLIHPSVMVRRSIINEVGCYRVEAEYTEDYDLWVRIAERANLANLRETLLYYRTWSENITSTHSSKMERQATLIVQRQLEKQLRLPVSLDMAAILRRVHDPRAGQEPGSVEDVRQSARLLEMLYHSHLKVHSPGLLDGSRIATDVAFKLLVLAKFAARFSRWQALALITQALLLNPLVLLRVIQIQARKLDLALTHR